MKRLALLIGSALLGGCCAVNVCHEGGHDICQVENSALFLVGCVPIMSGDIDRPNENTAIFWTDTMSVANNLYLLNKQMAAERARSLANLKTYRTDESVLFFLLKRSTLHTDAELVR